MKSTGGEPAKSKAKTAIRSISTKAKAKKPKGGATTKKTSKKKPTSVARRKTGNTKKTAPRKKKIASEDQQQQISTKNRRSDRNRNTSFNYEEASDHESNGALNKDGTSSRGNSRKEKNTKRASGRSKKDSSNNDDNTNNATEENWEIYDQGIVESDASWNEHYRQLQEFHSKHGHSGVPIDLVWHEESDFAEWVSRQRQLFREIRTGYRIASSREEGRWKRLQVLRFPLNYESWLWQKKYNELVEVLAGEKYTEETILPSPLRGWVDRQKSFSDGGVRGRIDSEGRSNLERLGVIVRDDTSSLASDDGE